MEPRFRFGPFELDVRARELRKDGVRLRVQDQPFLVLEALLEQPGEVVTREELYRRVWPAGTFVDWEHSLNAAVKRLRGLLGETADAPQFVETLPRRGYRFIATVHAEGLVPPESGSRSATPRLVVLPFSDLSEGPGDACFASSLAEELTACLGCACAPRLGVIGAVDADMRRSVDRLVEAARSLRADYALQGSVRRQADRARITVRLIETRGVTQLWAETYERSSLDLLAVQTEVAARVASSVVLELLGEPTAAQRPDRTSSRLPGWPADRAPR